MPPFIAGKKNNGFYYKLCNVLNTGNEIYIGIEVCKCHNFASMIMCFFSFFLFFSLFSFGKTVSADKLKGVFRTSFQLVLAWKCSHLGTILRRPPSLSAKQSSSVYLYNLYFVVQKKKKKISLIRLFDPIPSIKRRLNPFLL